MSGFNPAASRPIVAAMALFFLFLLGVVNFAMHKAVLESGHPLLGQVPWFVHMLNGRFSLAVEFVMLLAAMLMSAQGSLAWAWGYAFYSVLNGLSAWLILTNRV
ncbi:MAG: hypothetical protein ABIT04_11875 [Novosphingobium sp.]